jgi:hypothetical protein
MDLNKLKKEIPFKWRVQSYSKNKPVATCVAYIDSRDAQDLLDEVCTPAGWQCEYYEVKGNVYCKIGIKVDNEWIWKSDCGMESNVDAQKGEASDAFKRAFVKWGGGRFLYNKKIQYLPTNEKKDGKNYPYIIDSNGKKVWDITEEINKNKKAPQKTTPTPSKKAPAKPTPKAEPVALTDVQIESIITKGNQEVALDGIVAGKWTVTPAQMEKLQKLNLK